VSHLKYEPVTGHISQCIDRAIELARTAGMDCEFTFNGTTIKVSPNHRDQVYAVWYSKRPDGEPP
jgi:hypothetical protein